MLMTHSPLMSIQQPSLQQRGHPVTTTGQNIVSDVSPFTRDLMHIAEMIQFAQGSLEHAENTGEK